MRRSFTFAAIFLLESVLTQSHCLGQTPRPSTPVVPSAKLLADVDVLERVYETAHPGLYRYNTKERMARHFRNLRKEFARDRSLAQAYIVISQFLAILKCGHTYTNFVNQPQEIVSALFAGKNRVPFCFRWLNGRMIVTRDLSGSTTLKPGSEILALNGVAPSEILATLLTIARADGSNRAKRVAELEVQGTGKYEAFDIFLPLFFPVIGERLTLLVRKPGSETAITVRVIAHDMHERAALAKANKDPQLGESKPLWGLEQLDDQTAYLRMPSWAVFNSNWDWRTFVDRGFDDLIDRHVAGLIIDLRGNEGGLDVGNSLIARIAAAQVRSDRYRRYTRYRTLQLPKAFDACLNTWDQSFKDWGLAAKEDHDGFFRMTRYDDDENGVVITPRGRRYQGRVVVLIGAANSSATFQFAQLVKQNHLATLIGQTTGGNQRGINGGALFFVTLPHSKIECDLPLIATFVGDERPTGHEIPFQQIPDAGIDPDVPVEPSIEDVARGVETELQAARAFLAKGS
jgi:hypothetical protein